MSGRTAILSAGAQGVKRAPPARQSALRFNDKLWYNSAGWGWWSEWVGGLGMYAPEPLILCDHSPVRDVTWGAIKALYR